ncbi:lectin [Lysobacter terrestris]|uniref:Lectin n=1 Tax=Agrilutibacter terrestris TaxID=2865112 RepID=A0A7H0G1C2_9GAMM|nr:lectin [Lysobacter terrestris]
MACAAGCTDRAGRDAGNAAPAAAAPAASPSVPAREPQPAAPAATTPTSAANAISYAGFRDVRFGANADAVRAAWGTEMVGGPGDPQGCYYLYPAPNSHDGLRVGFMIEGQRFVRIDVDTDGVEAPGGGRVGMSADDIRGRYAGIVEQPHKYVEGARYLRSTAADGGSVLVFETDAAGKVSEWRVGVPPQVDYVEGCG